MSYDVIIIGGGINGTGVARDCALRGIRTLLIEKKDLCGGTSGASSGMVHGGLRYLLNDVRTTKTSCRDSGYIQRIAPFLHFRIPFLFLLQKKQGPNIELLETLFEIYDRYAKLKNGKPHTRLSHEDVFKLEPGLSHDITGAITFDEWGVDPYRLCVLNMKDATARRAEFMPKTEVRDLLIERDGNQNVVTGVKVQKADGSFGIVRGQLIVNLAGPWAPKIAKKAGIDIKLRPAKGIHIVFDRRISNYGFVTETIDKRSIFLMPYQNTSIIGTTDDDFYGDPDHLVVTQDEVQYLLESIERIYPDIRKHRVIGTYAGIRPTLYAWGKPEDHLSRGHKIFDHEKENVMGFVSMVGGKLASYRLMSEELTDLICKKLRVKEKCKTHTTPMPGAEETISFDEMKQFAQKAGMSHYVLSRLYSRHGANLKDILHIMDEHPNWRRTVCTSEPVTEAEIRYVIDHEWVNSLDDIGRRTRLGWGACHGMDCAWHAAQILHEMKGNDPHKEIKTFMQKRWRSTLPYLQGEGIAQEELKRFHMKQMGVLS